jgi:hypothetical protein
MRKIPDSKMFTFGQILLFLLVPISIILVIHYTPKTFWNYDKDCISTSIPKALDGGIMLEVALGLFIFCIPTIFKKIEVAPKNDQSVRKILVWKFFNETEWRAAFVIISLVFVHFFFLAPFEMHERDENTITALNGSIESNQDDLFLFKDYKSVATFVQLYNRSELNFKEGNWRLSAAYYNLATARNDWPLKHFAEAQLAPFYYFDLLKTNQIENENKTPDQSAINQFESGLTAMTNSFYGAILDGNVNDAFNGYDNLAANLVNLDIVKNMLDSIINNGNANAEVKQLPAFVNQIENSVQSLKNKTKNN